MRREEYNAKVQDMQRFCIAAGLDYRVTANETTTFAQFEVYYGKWHTVGHENNPMTPSVERIYDERKDAKIRYEVAGDISK